MPEINKNSHNIINKIKDQLGNPPDLIIKKLFIGKNELFLLSIESMSDSKYISDFILESLYFDIEKTKEKDFLNFLKHKIPAYKTNKISKLNDIIYNLLSGFTIIIVDGYDGAISIESKVKLNSDIVETVNERTTLGPKDGFTENYQTNIGLIRKRLKTPDLKFYETIIGNKGKSKVGFMYLDGVADKKTFDIIFERIKNIDIDAIFDAQEIIELISENEKNVFPNYVSTERPDYVSSFLLAGRIAIILENSPYIVIIPAIASDFLNNIEDKYNRILNSSVNRIIRYLSVIITILTPAIYVAMTTHNHEAIPPKLLVNFSIQRSGVPFSTIMEAFLMILTFEILKETDARAPRSYSNSLTIVGALVLGESAVNAGIVSPIMVIVIAITSISGLIMTYLDIANGIRWWRLMFLVGAAFAGFIGILIVGLIFITNITCVKSFGIPFLSGFAPYHKNNLKDSIFLNFKNKFTREVKKDIINPERNQGDN